MAHGKPSSFSAGAHSVPRPHDVGSTCARCSRAARSCVNKRSRFASSALLDRKLLCTCSSIFSWSMCANICGYSASTAGARAYSQPSQSTLSANRRLCPNQRTNQGMLFTGNGEGVSIAAPSLINSTPGIGDTGWSTVGSSAAPVQLSTRVTSLSKLQSRCTP